MSHLDEISYRDRDSVRQLSEALFDIAHGGRLHTRDPVARLVCDLLYGRYDDRSPAAIEAMVSRLLEIADDWYPLDVLMDRVAAVIIGAPLPAAPSWGHGRQQPPTEARLQ